MSSTRNLEIERKFLVDKTKWSSLTRAGPHLDIEQGYLSHDREKTVRVRTISSGGPTVESVGYLTIKGQSVGIARPEYEYLIPYGEAQSLLALCSTPHIFKQRWLVPTGVLSWEIDVFKDRLEGLVVAEIELEDENQSVILPDFVLKEVTSDPRYTNASLSRALFEQHPLPPFE